MYNAMYTEGSVMPGGGHVSDVNNATAQAVLLQATLKQVAPEVRYGNVKWDHTRCFDLDGMSADSFERSDCNNGVGHKSVLGVAARLSLHIIKQYYGSKPVIRPGSCWQTNLANNSVTRGNTATLDLSPTLTFANAPVTKAEGSLLFPLGTLSFGKRSNICKTWWAETTAEDSRIYDANFSAPGP